jgi:hypothetical protein
MKVRLCNQEDVNALISVVNHFDSIYGIDMDSSGIREVHINNIIQGVSSPTENIVAAFDENDNILGYCLQRFSKLNPVWFIINCYILPSSNNVNQYNASKIGGRLVELMVTLAEERNTFEFYYIVRDIGNKRLLMTLNATDSVKERYTFEDIEHIPPFSESKFKFIKNMAGLLTSGKNPKPLIVRKGFLQK